MHELQLMRQIVRLVDDISRDQGSWKPSVIRLQIGGHSHLTTHTLQELQTTFQMAALGTLAQGAELETITIPTKGICQTCNNRVERHHDTVTCPTCGLGHVLWEDQPEVLLQEVDWVEESV